MVSPKNRVVTLYDKTELILLLVRSVLAKDQYQEIDPARYQDFLDRWDIRICRMTLNVRLPKLYSVTSKEALDMVLKDKESTDEEGFVIWHVPSGHRVKCKTEHYLTLHYSLGKKHAETAFWELFAKGEKVEFLQLHPSFKERWEKTDEAWKVLLEKWNEFYVQHRHLPQKEFALMLKQHHEIPSSLCFAAKKLNHETLQQALESIDLANRMKLMQRVHVQ